MLGLARPVRWSVRSPSRPSEVRPKTLRAVGHQRIDDGGLAGVLDEADDGQRPAAGAGDDVVQRAHSGGVGAEAGGARSAAAGHRLPPVARRGGATTASRSARMRGARPFLAVTDLLEIREDRVAREVERLRDLLRRALDEERPALLEALDHLHLLFARHGGRRLADLAEGLRDHAGDHVADIAGEDLAHLGGAAAEAAYRREVGEHALGLHDLGDVVVEAEQAVGLAVLVPQRDRERLEDLAFVGRDVEAHVLRHVRVAEVAQHPVGGHIAQGAARDATVLDGDDGMGEPADVVEDDLALGAEHLGKPPNDGQQRLKARV